MKKIISLVIVIVLLSGSAFGLVSCGKTKIVPVDIEEKYSDFINVRGDLNNLYNKLNFGEETVISYLGGSVTAGFGSDNAEVGSWRAITFNWLSENFPEANIVQNNVAMGGTGSHLGAFRTKSDIIDTNSDLVFVEFSVNDSYSGTHSAGNSTLYFEQIIRQTREALPECDIIAVYVTDIAFAKEFGGNGMHSVAQAHEKVCEKYGITSIDAGRALCALMNGYDEELWGTYISDTVHPADAGYAVYAEAINEYLHKYLKGSPILEYKKIQPHALPEGYADERNENLKLTFVPADNYEMFDSIKGFMLEADAPVTGSHIKGAISAAEEKNELVFTFEGTGIDLYISGKGNRIEYSIDGGNTTRTIVDPADPPFKLAQGLEDGTHTLKLSFVSKRETRKIRGFFIYGNK
ncbi:MAG: SGNH/GDSL hydrolase family protein [Ruminococcaceae bacterium]|nr:SGNH/GDSL hydrolase family protein [Oscillospiraceae bacterium]